MYKMIAFDIDGTLINHLENEFSDQIIEMFRKLKEKGFILALSTGRDFISIGNLHKCKYIDYFIGANGMFIYDLRKEEYLLNHTINLDDFKKYNDEVLMNNLDDIRNIMLSDKNDVFVLENEEKNGPWFWDEFRCKFKPYDVFKDNLDTNNFHLITVENNINSQILAKTKEFFKKYENMNIDIQAYWPKGFFVATKTVTKAQSVKKLCEMLDININQVIAFGDGENDKELIVEAGLGVAMGNASDRIKAAADDITIDVSEYGTKFFLEKMGII